MRYVVAPSVRL